jgi:hypothetical protein
MVMGVLAAEFSAISATRNSLRKRGSSSLTSYEEEYKKNKLLPLISNVSLIGSGSDLDAGPNLVPDPILKMSQVND